MTPNSLIFRIARKAFPFKRYRFFRRLKYRFFQLIRHDRIFPDHHKILAQYIRGGAVVDVGTYKGTYSRFFLKHGASAVYGFEPNPEVHRFLPTRDKRFHLEKVGIGEHYGQMFYYAPKNQLGTFVPSLMVDHETTVNKYWVSVWPLDGFKLPKISLLKIDTDGLDFFVLKGAKKLIERDRPTVMVEVWEKGMRQMGYGSKEIIDFMKPFGYSHISIPDDGYSNLLFVQEEANS